jgi:serine/threonine-protein kinase RsbW
VIRKVFRTISHPGDSRRLAREVVDYLSSSVVDTEVLHDLDIILTEGCANVCRHAYSGDPGNLEVRLDMEPGQFVELEIVDWGKGFGPNVQFRNPGPEAEGGRGLYLMCMLSDACRVSRQGQENVVFIHKDIGLSQWKS